MPVFLLFFLFIVFDSKAAPYGSSSSSDSSVSAGSIGTLNADTSTTYQTSLRIAARENKYKEVQRLLEVEKVPVDCEGEYGETALMYAARYNSIRSAMLLLKHGANTNARDLNDETPLMKAAKNCSFLISKKMLEDKNTNYNLRDHNGKTALTYATEGGCSLIVNQLLEMPSIDRKLDLY